MNNYTLVTVAGQIGSGKTEVCRRLSATTGRTVISAGAILRKVAADRKMTVLEVNDLARFNTEIDDTIDAYLVSLRGTSEKSIIDSRLAWHFLPCAYNVYLIVEPWVGAERIFHAARPDERYMSVEDAHAKNETRQRFENERFRSLYSINCASWRNYDLVVDSTDVTPEFISALIVKAIAGDRAAEATGLPACWLSSKRLIPTASIRETRGGSDETARVDIAVYGGSFFIVDGHSRVSAALRQGIDLLPCNLVAFEDEEAVPESTATRFAESTSLASIEEWEGAHKFHFRSYPGWLTQRGRDLSETASDKR